MKRREKEKKLREVIYNTWVSLLRPDLAIKWAVVVTCTVS